MTETVKKLGVQAQLGRWGGEEFMICITGEDSKNAQQIAEALRLAFNEIEFEQAGHQTITAGVSTFKQGDTAEAVYKRSDDALYLGKRNGKNKVVVL